MSGESLLPRTSGNLERRLEALGGRYKFENQSKKLWNPLTCPEDALIYLAWALSVDYWDDGWGVETKRKVILGSLDIHRMKGTSKSMRDAADTLSYSVDIRYWHDDPSIPKGMFIIDVDATGLEINESMYQEISSVINKTKRGTLHQKGFHLTNKSVCDLRVKAMVKIGEVIRVLPSSQQLP